MLISVFPDRTGMFSQGLYNGEGKENPRLHLRLRRASASGRVHGKRLKLAALGLNREASH